MATWREGEREEGRARDENKKGESLKSQSPFSADKWAVSSDSVTQRTNAWHESVCCSVHL